MIKSVLHELRYRAHFRIIIVNTRNSDKMCLGFRYHKSRMFLRLILIVAVRHDIVIILLYFLLRSYEQVFFASLR